MRRNAPGREAEMRIGVVYQAGGLGASTSEQLLGTRLAAAHTQSETPGPGGPLEVIEREVGAEGTAFEAELSALVHGERCDALLGILPVPRSVETAQWCEAEGVLYSTANNNPLLWQGRKHVFHIGVPSEVTAAASMRYLHGERGASRIAVLHTPGEFQVFAAHCIVEAGEKLGVSAIAIDVGLDAAAGAGVAGQIEAYSPDAICVMASELDRVSELAPMVAAWRRQSPDADRPALFARGMLCREFADRNGAIADGFDFIDLYVRGEGAPAEERALVERLASADPRLVATASHGFGWDCLRLLVAALRPGLDGAEAAARLESADFVPGATGPLHFAATDHNGRWQYDPTTIARLREGRFVTVSRLARG